jgi:hypothetical protein
MGRTPATKKVNDSRTLLEPLGAELCKIQFKTFKA